MALVGASLLMGKVGPDLIYFSNLQEKLLGSAEMATFSLVVSSLFLIGPRSFGTQ